jgi:ABC-type multidrug transport system ATPase subunit
MIEAHDLVQRYGSTVAVDDLSFSIRPGMVTGFLGPNGAGKTTTMRMILGLDAPTQGSVTVGGRSYRDLPAPLREVGALLDAKALHGGRRARDHLLCLAQSNGIPRSRWTRCSASSVSRAWPGAGRRASRWAWVSGSASPRRSSGTRPCSSSTNR